MCVAERGVTHLQPAETWRHALQTWPTPSLHSPLAPTDTPASCLSSSFRLTPITADYELSKMNRDTLPGNETAVGADLSRPPPIYRPMRTLLYTLAILIIVIIGLDTHQLSKNSSLSVGARAVWSGRVGLYGTLPGGQVKPVWGTGNPRACCFCSPRGEHVPPRATMTSLHEPQAKNPVWGTGNA